MVAKVRSVLGILVVLLFLAVTGGCSQHSLAGADVCSYQVNEGKSTRLMHVVCIQLDTIPQLSPLGIRSFSRPS